MDNFKSEHELWEEAMRNTLVDVANKRIERITKEYEKQQNQKAIEELENVLVHCKEKFEWFENTEHKEGYDNTDVSNAYFDVQCAIEDRIKELKGE